MPPVATNPDGSGSGWSILTRMSNPSAVPVRLITLLAVAAALLGFGLTSTDAQARSANAACLGLAAVCDLGDPIVGNMITGGTTTVCAIKPDRSLKCWGGNSDGQATAPAGTGFASVAVGGYHACAIKQDRSVVCWGDNHFLQSTVGGTTCSPDPASSTMKSICPESASPTTPREIAAIDISAGKFHTCVVQADRTIACWGLNVDMNGNPAGQATPPDGCGGPTAAAVCLKGLRARGGRFASENYDYARVSAGGYHTCGLKREGAIVCWGGNWAGQAETPDGTGYKAVTAGRTHTCALKSDSSIVCWGENGDGRATPPSGTGYKAITAGYSNSCAVRSDSRIVCWGAAGTGVNSVPSGTFKTVAMAGNTGCAQRADGTILCWGDTSKGQTTIPSGVNPTGPTLTMTLIKGLGKGKWQIQITAKAGSSALSKVQLSTSSSKPSESASKSSAKNWATRVSASGSRPKWIRIGDSGGRWTVWTPVQPQIQV